jgi:hypothetical protein
MGSAQTKAGAGATIDVQLVLSPGMTEMRTLAIAAIIALLAVPAYAQGKGMSPSLPKGGVKTEQEKAADEKQRILDEKAFKDSLSRIPDREQKPDPWGKVR